MCCLLLSLFQAWQLLLLLLLPLLLQLMLCLRLWLRLRYRRSDGWSR